MDSDSDSDTVIITHKPSQPANISSPSTKPQSPPSASASPVKRASVSFASIASSVGTPTMEATGTVGVKA